MPETPNSVNVTANYYPVNSAILIRDDEKQMFVMNDRSQGGSVLVDGRIELMQNRRSNADDARGVGEDLDEKDANGNGITVPATYWVNYKSIIEGRRDGSQRFLQQWVDAPAQQFFGFGGSEINTLENAPYRMSEGF